MQYSFLLESANNGTVFTLCLRTRLVCCQNDNNDELLNALNFCIIHGLCKYNVLFPVIYHNPPWQNGCVNKTLDDVVLYMLVLCYLNVVKWGGTSIEILVPVVIRKKYLVIPV